VTQAMDAPSTPGLRLKSRRVLLGMKQADVARAAHLSRTTLSKLENDEGFEGLGVGHLASLCEVLRCSLDYIARGDE
jgi:transcriptional regulator with XRE-family HTH domain